MPTSTVNIDVRLNLEGDWPRSAYRQHCEQTGIDYTEDGYLRWRTVGERLSGRQSLETSVKRASAALAACGVSIADFGKQWQRVIKRQQAYEEGELRSSKHADTDADR